ncbi:hypothetical protein COLO4_36819 [Corchorus olitorius]|uniref:Uncharacterized protein n=1 Tax=Corchorus olitorius TaxID=93759 RepID=A0A1R3G592_9ROSI|nr:hypothetical protein COLO4_36819 [Corchorus olitorius]
MEDRNSSSTTKEESAPALYHPWSFNEAIRAILRCLGLEKLEEFHQNPSTPKKEDDAKLKNITNVEADGCQESPAVAYTEEGADPPSTTDDPPSTTANDPSVVVVLATPTRRGTRTGSGPQIN